MDEEQEKPTAQHQATSAQSSVAVSSAITQSRSDDQKKRTSIHEPLEAKNALPDARSGTFPQFEKLPTELQTNIIRQHTFTDRPLIVYKGLGLSRAEGPQPFCGPNSTNLAIYRIEKLSPYLSQVMKEPALFMHVFEITPENMDNLANWQFPSDTPVTKFQNVTFNLGLELAQPSLTNQLQLTRDFLPRFSSAVNVEIYFGNNVGGRNYFRNHAIANRASGTTRTTYHDFKRAMREVTTLQSIEICHGMSFENSPEGSQGWEKNSKQNWVLSDSPTYFGKAWGNSIFKGGELQTFKDGELQAFYLEERRRKSQRTERS